MQLQFKLPIISQMQDIQIYILMAYHYYFPHKI
jgi:hypothetical protein